jgi:hypothetical protein
MKSLSNFILEKRKNPELNKKLPPIEQIKNYYDMPNNKRFFTSFTDVFKIGINPHSHYRTPIGIYTYPINPAYKIYMEPKDTVKGVPFANKAENIFIVKQNNKGGVFLMDMVKDYTLANYKKDIKLLKKFFGGIKNKYLTGKYEDYDLIDLIIEEGELDARNKTPIGKMWNITRLISTENDLIKNVNWLGNKSNVNWNTIWRKLGYSGMCDRHGDGIIHPAEKIQAVFFSKTAFDVVDHIWNVKSNETAERWWSKVAKLHREGKIKKIINLEGHRAEKHGTKPKPTLIDWDSTKFSWIFNCDFKIDTLYIGKYWLKLSGGVFNKGEIAGNLSHITIKGGSIAGYKNGSLDTSGKISLNPTTNFVECTVNGGTWNMCKVMDCKINGGKFISCNTLISKINNTEFVDGDIKNSDVNKCNIEKTELQQCKVTDCTIKLSGINYGSMKNTKYNIGKNDRRVIYNVNIENCLLNNANIKLSTVIDSAVTGNGTFDNSKYIIKKPNIKVFGNSLVYSAGTFKESVWDAPLNKWKSDNDMWSTGNEIISDLSSVSDMGKYRFSPTVYSDYVDSGEGFNEYKRNNNI